MWNGEYSFFDYKYNIEGYSGQDYDGAGRWVYLVFSVVAILAMLIIFRNAKKKNIERYLKIVAVIMPILEITKVTWESRWDIVTGRGFNWEGLLPLYTCSLFIYCMLFAAFGKGKVRDYCLAWVATLGFVGGVSNLIFIRGLKWYPFFTFGAFYSMFFHFIMVFTALFIVVTGYRRFEWRDILRAFAVHCFFSLIIIPIDYIFGWDYMQYYDAGGVPVIENIVDKFEQINARALAIPLMLGLYFLLDGFLLTVYIGLQRLTHRR